VYRRIAGAFVRLVEPTRAAPNPGSGRGDPAWDGSAVSGYDLSAMPADATSRQEF
jgi:hypothetical protein